MKIGINASFARKPNAGMGQTTLNFLRALAEKVKNAGENDEEFKDVEFILYLEEDIDFEPTDFLGKFQKNIFLPKYKRDDLIRKIWWEKCLLPKKIKEDGCDYFVSLYQSTTVLKDVKHLMVVHDTIPEIFPEYLNNSRKKIYYKLVKKATQKADEIVTVSKNSKKDVEKFYGIPKEKISVAHNDCDQIFKKEIEEEEIESVLEKHDLRENDYIIYVGGFDKRKNVDGLIRAYGKFWQKNEKDKIPSPTLAIVGEFHPHLVPLMIDIPGEIKKVQEKYEVPKSAIKELGFVDQVDLPALYKAAKFFCFPSFYEGFGNMPLEAMNMGVPVITSNNSSLPEVVGKNTALLIEDPSNTDEIVEAMHALSKDEELRKKLVAAGKRRAKNFSWNKQINVILKSINQKNES